MGKTGKWLPSFLFAKKGKDKEKKREERCGNQPSSLPTGTRSAPGSVPTPNEKRRWSFRRSAVPGKDFNSQDMLAPASSCGFLDSDIDRKRHAMAVAAAATDAAVAAAQAAAAVIRLTTAATIGSSSVGEAAAAIRIQTAFRSYLARKALCALKGLVKLQALVRGHLVRKQAANTLRCMQALVTAQARARAQRIRMLEKAYRSSQSQSNSRRSPRNQQSNELDGNVEENIKIVEMDHGESWSSSRSWNSHSLKQTERTEQKKVSSSYGHNRRPSKVDPLPQVSPSTSALTDMCPRAYSGEFEDFSFPTAQSSPQYFSASFTPFYPNYMANTESSRAKVRSQSAPKQRPDSRERQPTRRRTLVEGRNTPQSEPMQRSSSAYQHPWSIKLDKSGMSVTTTNHFKSLMAYELST